MPFRHENKLHNLIEDRLGQLIDAAPNGMLMVNSNGEIVFVNTQIEQMFQFSRAELLGQPVEMLVPAESRAAHPDYRNNFFLQPHARAMGVGGDLFGLRKDGTQIPVEIGLNPFVTDETTFVLASIVDITERKKYEERLRLIIEASPSGMIMVDRRGTIVLVNSQIESLFGYTREELLGKSIEILVPHASRATHPEHRERFFQEPTSRAMGVGRDLFGLRKDGSQIPIEIGLNPIEDKGERFVLASVVDITERKRSEELVREKVLELQRSNEDLQQFAYVCSHDLQEPLRVISNYTQLIAKRYRGQLDENADDFIQFVVDASKRMQGLINDLLIYSRVQSRSQEFREANCSTLISMAIANLSLAIQENQAQFVIDKMPTVIGDPTQLLQLFQNLLANAIKFRSESAPLIHVKVDKRFGEWHFMIEDNGIGFDIQYAERIFVIFQRLHTREQYSGSGIGLSICKKIVERHGGRIWVESSPGRGTTFHFTLHIAPKYTEATNVV